MKFRVTDNSYEVNGRVYKRDTIVESDKDLRLTFPNKFELVGDDAETSPGEGVQGIINGSQTLMPAKTFNDGQHHDDAVRIQAEDFKFIKSEDVASGKQIPFADRMEGGEMIDVEDGLSCRKDAENLQARQERKVLARKTARDAVKSPVGDTPPPDDDEDEDKEAPEDEDDEEEVEEEETDAEGKTTKKKTRRKKRSHSH